MVEQWSSKSHAWVRILLSLSLKNKFNYSNKKYLLKKKINLASFNFFKKFNNNSRFSKIFFYKNKNKHLKNQDESIFFNFFKRRNLFYTNILTSSTNYTALIKFFAFNNFNRKIINQIPSFNILNQNSFFFSFFSTQFINKIPQKINFFNENNLNIYINIMALMSYYFINNMNLTSALNIYFDKIKLNKKSFTKNTSLFNIKSKKNIYTSLLHILNPTSDFFSSFKII